MRLSVPITIDLTATTETRSKSEPVPVPAWARSAAVYPRISSWSGAAAELLEATAGGGAFFSFGTAATFSANTPVRNIDVRYADRVRLETTTGNASADADARFEIVFTDLEA